jgi:hypothetical protein
MPLASHHILRVSCGRSRGPVSWVYHQPHRKSKQLRRSFARLHSTQAASRFPFIRGFRSRVNPAARGEGKSRSTYDGYPGIYPGIDCPPIVNGQNEQGRSTSASRQQFRRFFLQINLFYCICQHSRLHPSSDMSTQQRRLLGGAVCEWLHGARLRSFAYRSATGGKRPRKPSCSRMKRHGPKGQSGMRTATSRCLPASMCADAGLLLCADPALDEPAGSYDIKPSCQTRNSSMDVVRMGSRWV